MILLFFPSVAHGSRKDGSPTPAPAWRLATGSLRAKYGGSVTLKGCLIAEFPPAIKPRMRQKCRRRRRTCLVITSRKTGTNRIRTSLAPFLTSPALTQWRASRRTIMLGALLAGLGTRVRAQGATHAIAMHGEPAWGPDFRFPTYANPAAPKGGQLVQGVLGAFDCLNPFIVKGLPAANIRGYVVESLLARGYDEPFTLYGLLADSVVTDPARSYVTFALNPAARFSDGKPVTPEDVVFSWELLRDKGRPNYRTYDAKVTKAEQTGER